MGRLALLALALALGALGASGTPLEAHGDLESAVVGVRAKQAQTCFEDVELTSPTFTFQGEVVGILTQGVDEVQQLQQLSDDDYRNMVAIALFVSQEVVPTHYWQVPPVLGHAALSVLFAVTVVSGTLPSQLGLNTDLSILSITGCEALRGSIPSEFGQLRGLVELQLGSNPLVVGTLPTQLGGLSNLEVLEADYTGVTGTIPSQLGKLSSLTILDLGPSAIRGTVPTQLALLTQLQELDLLNMGLQGTLPLAVALLGVDDAWFGNTGLELGPGPLFPNATTVFVEHTVIASTWPPMGSPVLRELRLFGSRVHGAIPSELALQTWLELVDARNNLLTGALPSQLGLLTSLTSLALNDNRLSSSVPAEMLGLTRLTALWLGNNELRGTVASQFGLMETLRGLGLADNRLSGTIPSQLGNLRELVDLNVAGNALHGPIPSQLGLLLRLERIGLAHNALTGTIPLQVLAITSVTFANVSWNRLEGLVHDEDGSRAVWLDECDDSGLDERACAYTCPGCSAGAVALVACDWKGRNQWCVHWGIVAAAAVVVVGGWLGVYSKLLGTRGNNKTVGVLAAKAVFSTVEFVLDLLFTGGSTGVIFRLGVSFLVVLGAFKFALGVATLRSLRPSLSRPFSALVCVSSVAHVVVLKDVLHAQSKTPPANFTLTYLSLGLVEALAEGTLQLLTLLQNSSSSNVVVAAFAFSAVSFVSLAALAVVLLLSHKHAQRRQSSQLEMSSVQQQQDSLPRCDSDAPSGSQAPSSALPGAAKKRARWRVACLVLCCVCAVVATVLQASEGSHGSVEAAERAVGERARAPRATTQLVPVVAAAHTRTPKQSTQTLCGNSLDPWTFNGPFACVLGQVVAVIDSLGATGHTLEELIPLAPCAQLVTQVQEQRLPTTIGLLSRLKVFVIANFLGTLPTELGLLTELAYLDLDETDRFSDIPSQLGLLSALTTLRLRNLVSSSTPSQLGVLPKLQYLEISNAQAGTLPSQLGQLETLQSLILWQLPVDNAFPSQFGLLRNLSTVDAQYATLRGALPSQMGLLQRLTAFRVSNNALEGDTLQLVAALPNMVRLNVGDNLLSGPLLCPGCAPSPGLQKLVAHGNRIAGALPSQLGIATALTELSLQSNRELAGSIPSQLGLLQRLAILQLDHCSLTGPLPSQLALLTNLHTVTVGHNRLSGGLPPGVNSTAWLAGCDHSGIDHPKCVRECPNCRFTELKVVGCDGRGHGHYCLPFYVMLGVVGVLAFAMRVAMHSLVKAKRSKRELIGSSLVSTVAAVHLVLDALFVANADGAILYTGTVVLCAVVASRLVFVTDEFLFLESLNIVRISEKLRQFALALLLCVVDPSTVRGMLKIVKGHHRTGLSLRGRVLGAHVVHDAPMLCLQIAASVVSHEPLALQALIGTLASMAASSRLCFRWHARWDSAMQRGSGRLTTRRTEPEDRATPAVSGV